MTLDIFMRRFASRMSYLSNERAALTTSINQDKVRFTVGVLHNDIFTEVATLTVTETGEIAEVKPRLEARVYDWQRVQEALAA